MIYTICIIKFLRPTDITYILRSFPVCKDSLGQPLSTSTILENTIICKESLKLKADQLQKKSSELDVIVQKFQVELSAAKSLGFANVVKSNIRRFHHGGQDDFFISPSAEDAIQRLDFDSAEKIMVFVI